MGFLDRLFKSDREEAAELEYAGLLVELDASDPARTKELVRAIRDESAATSLESEEVFAYHLAAFQRYADSALRDDFLTFDEDNVLHELRETLGLSYETLYAVGQEQLIDRLFLAHVTTGSTGRRVHPQPSMGGPGIERGNRILGIDVCRRPVRAPRSTRPPLR